MRNLRSKSNSNHSSKAADTEKSCIDENVEVELADVLHDLEMENLDEHEDGDACVLEMSGNDYNSMGALQALMDQAEVERIGKKGCGEDLG